MYRLFTAPSKVTHTGVAILEKSKSCNFIFLNPIPLCSPNVTCVHVIPIRCNIYLKVGLGLILTFLDVFMMYKNELENSTKGKIHA